MAIEVTTSWNIPSGIPTKTYMYFADGTPLPTIRAALGTFWGAVDGSLAPTVFWSVDPTGVLLDDTTGALTGEWSDPTAIAGSGSGSGQPVADATQINVQWNTASIINGRRVRGRTYVPGLAAAALSGGNLAEANRAAITAAGTTLAASNAEMRVWHRPKAGTGGTTVGVVDAVCRSELAVLRLRRNRG